MQRASVLTVEFLELIWTTMQDSNVRVAIYVGRNQKDSNCSPGVMYDRL